MHQYIYGYLRTMIQASEETYIGISNNIIHLMRKSPRKSDSLKLQKFSTKKVNDGKLIKGV